MTMGPRPRSTSWCIISRGFWCSLIFSSKSILFGKLGGISGSATTSQSNSVTVVRIAAAHIGVRAVLLRRWHGTREIMRRTGANVALRLACLPTPLLLCKLYCLGHGHWKIFLGLGFKIGWTWLDQRWPVFLAINTSMFWAPCCTKLIV